MVKAVVSGGAQTKDLLFFTPELTEPGLSMEDRAFQLGGGKSMTATVTNHGDQTLCLKRVVQIGGVQSVTKVSKDEGADGSEPESIHKLTAVTIEAEGQIADSA